ncbi:MAG: glycine cleavage system aminomethyltransferase GcvT [Betaproteobacteria bacterium]|nr:glycine cleavage system aminomethyltransferase GcvT [Betaproteobacteria bacterium]
MLKRTPLYDTHLGCGAKTVDFGGWDMPLHYGSQLDEHHAVRRGAGMFDVSHMLAVDMDGRGTSDFLRRLLANDVARLVTPGKALYACMLNEAGGVIDDLIVYRLAPERFRLVVNAGTADKDLGWMRAQGGAPRERRELSIIAVQGPEARAKVWSVRPQWKAQALPVFAAAEFGPVTVARTGYTGEDGFEIILPAADAPSLWNDLRSAGVAPCGLGARDTLRLEAGMNLYGKDMEETVSPLDAGLAWTVAMKDARAFIGRAALESKGQSRAFLGLKLAERGVMRSHMKVLTARGDGEVTSGTFSPTMNLSIALARLPLGSAPGEAVQVEMRGKPVPATVVKPPFVRNGRILA